MLAHLYMPVKIWKEFYLKDEVVCKTWVENALKLERKQAGAELGQAQGLA